MRFGVVLWRESNEMTAAGSAEDAHVIGRARTGAVDVAGKSRMAQHPGRAQALRASDNERARATLPSLRWGAHVTDQGDGMEPLQRFELAAVAIPAD